MTQHDEVQEALGAYALDAVDPAEREEIERHLATCPRCRAEVAEHREVAAMLGYAGAVAPPGLWDRIAASLEEPPPALALTRVAPGSPPEPVPDEAAPVPLAPARRSIGMRTFATFAALAAIVAAVLGVAVARVNTRTDRLGSSIGIEAISAAYKTALGNPGTRRVSMRSNDGTHTLPAAIQPDGTAYLGPGNLPVLPPGQTYQLWGVVGSNKISLAVMGATPKVIQFGAPAGVSALAVTAEPAGGVVVPEHPAVVVGTVPPLA
jgi:anti-sigma factor RsiW